MVDHFSGFPFVAHLKSTTTKTILNRLSTWFMDFGFPHIIRSDGGPQFRSEFNAYCKTHNIKKQRSSAYYPQSNGLAENGVKSMKRLLKKCKNNWPKFLEALLHWRNMPRPDGHSPAQLMFGFKQNFGMTNLSGQPLFTDREQAAQRRKQLLQAPHAKHFDGHAKDLKPLNLDDLVLIQNRTTNEWDSSGRIIEILPDSRSYIVADEQGNPHKRNRRHLRPDTSADS